MKQGSSRDLDLTNHFTMLIYPFLHHVAGNERSKRLEALAAQWAPWWTRLADEQIAKALDNTYFFLPYIRSVIFPETMRLSNEPVGPQYENWVKKINQWNGESLDAFYSVFASGGILRLTYKSESRAAFERFTVTQRVEENGKLIDHQEITACLDWVDAMLFPAGVGFLILKIRLAENPERLSKLIDLNYHLRLVHPPQIGWTLPTLRFGNPEVKMSVRALMDFLLQEMVSTDSSLSSDPVSFAKLWEQSQLKHYTDSESGQVYGERCQLLSFACVNIEEDSRESLESGAFACAEDRLLYEFATSTALGDSVSRPEWKPASEWARKLIAENGISLWQCWRAMALKESAVFLGTEDVDFNRRVLAYNIENDYLPLYLYTLYQKFQLYVFSNDLLRKGANVEQNLREMRSLADRFISFRNRYWFNEVTRKPMGDELYRKFQQGLGVSSIYDLVNGEVNGIEEHYEERRNQRLGAVLNLLTFLFVPLSAVIGFFGMNFVTYGSVKRFIVACVVALGGIYGSYRLWRWWTKK